VAFTDNFIGRRVRVPGHGIAKVTSVSGNWGESGFVTDPTASMIVTLCSATDIRVMTTTTVTLTPVQFESCQLVHPVYNFAGAIAGYYIDSDAISLG
jgi:hypothetical protein